MIADPKRLEKTVGGALLVGCLSLSASSCFVSDEDTGAAQDAARCEAIVREDLHVRARGPIVLVTVDGVRWQDVFDRASPARLSRAHVPNMAALVEDAKRGVALGAEHAGRSCGIVYASGGSNVSLPGYIEILTGRPSRCLDNACPRVPCSVLDEAALAHARGVASISSWDVVANAATSRNVPPSDDLRSFFFVSAGRAWPTPIVSLTEAQRTAIEHATPIASARDVDPAPGRLTYRPDAWTRSIAEAYFSAFRPAVFHVGLGDTDELAHEDDAGGYVDALARADAFVGTLANSRRFAEDGLLLVTADHGRANDFRDHGPLALESARSWIIAIRGGVPSKSATSPSGEAPCLPRDVKLADLAPTIRVLLDLPPDTHTRAGAPIDEVIDLADAPSAEAAAFVASGGWR